MGERKEVLGRRGRLKEKEKGVGGGWPVRMRSVV